MTNGKQPNQKNDQEKESIQKETEDTPVVPPTEEYSLEELDEATERVNREREAEDIIDTAHTDGSTSNPHQAQEQGLVYDAPSDPPVLPSDDPQGAEIAAGFASSMEESNPDRRRLPDRVDNQDWDLVTDVQSALRNNSETTHLDDVQVRVEDGIVFLSGTVVSEEDIAVVQYVVRELDGVKGVRNNLSVAE